MQGRRKTSELMRKRYSSVLLSNHADLKSENSTNKIVLLENNSNHHLKLKKQTMVPDILHKIEKNCQALRNIYGAEQRKKTNKNNEESQTTQIRSVMENQLIKSELMKSDQFMSKKDESKSTYETKEKNIFQIYRDYKHSFDRKLSSHQSIKQQNKQQKHIQIIQQKKKTNITKGKKCVEPVKGKKKIKKKIIEIQHPSRPVSIKKHLKKKQIKKIVFPKTKYDERFEFPIFQQQRHTKEQKQRSLDSLADCSISKIQGEIIPGQQNLFALDL